MIRGQGEIRYFNWENGQGALHKNGFDCQKNCHDPSHIISFDWKSLVRSYVGNDITTGTVLAYSAYLNGGGSAVAKTLNPIRGQ